MYMLCLGYLTYVKKKNTSRDVALTWILYPRNLTEKICILFRTVVWSGMEI